MDLEELPTPCVLVDLDVVERNIRTMAEYCRSKKCQLRPHGKSHKSPFIARKQVQAGAVGLCCQTLDEAEAMILGGIDHVLLTHMLASPSAVERFLNLKQNGDIMVTVDGQENAEMLARAARHRNLLVDVIVEVNVGNNKTGQEPGEPATKFALWLSRLGGLRFKGLMGYEGHLQQSIPEFEKREREVQIAQERLNRTVSMLREQGQEPEIVTGGGTGTYNITSACPHITEIQPGSYVMMDKRYSQIRTAGQDFGMAMTILSTVVSTPNQNQAVIDMGWKGFGGMEYEALGVGGMPMALAEGLTYSLGGDEHGILKCKDPAKRPRVGDKIRFIPGHCDTTLNLYGKFHGTRGDRVEIVCPVARR